VTRPQEPTLDELVARLGQVTRSLHDSLRAVGFDALIEKAAQAIPDTRDRLDYVARMTEQAASRVLTATETATPIQDRIEAGAAELTAGWKAVLGTTAQRSEYREMAERTLRYLDAAGADAAATKAQLMEIMMAQDFQDLTGQVIKRISELVQHVEQQLLLLLVDFTPAADRDAAAREVAPSSGNRLINGPQLAPAADVVADQHQVDDLLESLGF
jgi:chemotaxis protein CheZ